jgi:hypothetical protein
MIIACVIDTFSRSGNVSGRICAWTSNFARLLTRRCPYFITRTSGRWIMQIWCSMVYKENNYFTYWMKTLSFLLDSISSMYRTQTPFDTKYQLICMTKWYTSKIWYWQEQQILVKKQQQQKSNSAYMMVVKDVIETTAERWSVRCDNIKRPNTDGAQSYSSPSSSSSSSSSSWLSTPNLFANQLTLFT